MAAMAKQEQENSSCGCHPCICWLIVATIATVVITLAVAITSKDPVYSVTITGVAGLDPAADLSLSPVFNLTVRIDNARDQLDEGCIGRLSTAVVSYGDAVLGRGSVPQFCAKKREVQERAARAWGQHVDLPQFLQDQLAGELAAGEAAVDVMVTTPDLRFRDMVLVCSQAKIGGGPAPCRKVYV